MQHLGPLGANWYLRGRLGLRHLRLLVVLDETRNVGEAARRLATTQPAVSKMLADLEDMVGLALFTRTPKGTFPTPHGESFIRHARWILGDLDRLGDEWPDKGAVPAERVTIGINSSSAAFLAPNAILRLESLGLPVVVVVREGSLEALMPALEARQLDLIVARLGSATRRPSLTEQRLGHESMSVVCSTRHPLASEKICGWEEVTRYPWIMPPTGSPVRAAFDLILSRQGLKPLSRIESASVGVNMVLMERSDALSLMPRGVARYHAGRGSVCILPIDIPDVFGPLGIVRHAHLAPSPGVERLIECLQEEAALMV
jgi:DNA-binding transcriptional LysR family regulator